MGIFSDAQGQLTAVLGRIWLKFELVRDIMVVLVTCKYEEDLTKNDFLHKVKLVLISDTYCILMICYTPIATFQKAGTCLDAQQSMAKQPIKGCVSNHSRTCGKSVSEKSE